MPQTEARSVVLAGRFVRLRPLELEDTAMTLRWRLSDRAAHLQKGAGNENEQRAWIAAHINHPGEFNFIIECGAAPVGMVALHDINHTHHSAAMGRLLIGEPAIVGPAPVFFETEMLICDYAFEELKMHKIYGDIMETNIGMIRTQLYLGFKQDGILREHYFSRGAFRNTIALSLLEDEYRNVCRPKLVQMISLMGRLH